MLIYAQFFFTSWQSAMKERNAGNLSSLQDDLNPDYLVDFCAEELTRKLEGIHCLAKALKLPCGFNVVGDRFGMTENLMLAIINRCQTHSVGWSLPRMEQCSHRTNQSGPLTTLKHLISVETESKSVSHMKYYKNILYPLCYFHSHALNGDVSKEQHFSS